tara:strand:+ start:1262 stop:1432 length:171 start_codon:yes stop_codon:yes gene_type:complete
MNRNVKIAIGIALGIGVIYLGYRFFYKGSESKGTDTSKEDLVHDKASREVILVENN